MLAKFLFDSDPSSTAFCTDAKHDSTQPEGNELPNGDLNILSCWVVF
jgi:hypothetical protein